MPFWPAEIKGKYGFFSLPVIAKRSREIQIKIKFNIDIILKFAITSVPVKFRSAKPMDMYKKLKRQNGERFARTIRDHHDGLLEIPDLDVILRHAGRDAEPIIPYLLSLISDAESAPIADTQDPFELLDQAGYDAFYADTLKKQNSIKRYFRPGELLCTFKSASRFERYHIVHAVKKDVEDIHRKNFERIEQRQDEYGTSVISIQILKKGGFIKITNRYNHSVAACDHTFDSNPDNIIEGLSESLKKHFNVDFTARNVPIPNGYTFVHNGIFKYFKERNNFYFGHNMWLKNGNIHLVDRASGDALFDQFLFNNKEKRLTNLIPDSKDSFANDFNKFYGGNKNLHVQNGNLMLGDQVIIGADNSRITALYLPGFKFMSTHCLHDVNTIEHFEAPDLFSMGRFCMRKSPELKSFIAPSLHLISRQTMFSAPALTHLHTPSLSKIGRECLRHASSLKIAELPSLKRIGDNSLSGASALEQLIAPSLILAGRCSFSGAPVYSKIKNIIAMNKQSNAKFKHALTPNVPAHYPA